MSDVPTRLLRETLRDQTEPEGAGCIDADTLAAWSEGTLTATQRANVESHASNCGRCQALLAAMTIAAPPAPERRWFRASTLGWLVPLAGAAAAVLLWINVPEKSSEHYEAPTVAKATADAPAPAAPKTESAAPAPERRQKLDARAAERAKRVEPTVQPSEKQREGAASSHAEAFAQAPPTAAAASAAGSAAAGSPPPASPAPATAPPRTAQMPELARGALADRHLASERVQVMAKAAQTAIDVVSKDANVRWRLLAGGAVDRSTDGGATWQTQSTGVSVALTAGAAPSATVCWLVGPGGVVVLSTDGRTWQRVAFPETTDLVSIRASDRANASVVTADGRSFTTADGGQTWRQP